MSTWGMIRLGASVEENALDTIQELVGYSNPNDPSNHKPARADIQKLKDVWILYNDAAGLGSARKMSEPHPHPEAEEEWEEKYELDSREEQLVRNYLRLIQEQGMYPAQAFDQIVYTLAKYGDYVDVGPATPVADSFRDIKGDEAAAKKLLGGALKKYEQQNWPELYRTISIALDDAFRRDATSYKLWPWMVKQIKDGYKRWLEYGNKRVNFEAERLRSEMGVDHLVDITAEGGALLSKLRADNRIPQNFDVNKMNLSEFEDWLMEWKRENVESESQGEVVYEFHDGWTIQKLDTPAQLQFEGDEMGHCVGGYAHEVEDGSSIIYSLRDPKGRPHVTMEIEGKEAYLPADQHPGTSGYSSVEEALNENGIESYEPPGQQVGDKKPHIYEALNPTEHEPGTHSEEAYRGAGKWQKTGERPFQVVQIQGNGNMTPKPEYQRKIREFLDYLRSKGWNFERSENWYGNYDNGEEVEGYDTAEDYRVKDAASLDDWWDEHYRPYYDLYQKGGEDAYGMKADRIYPSIGDWDDLLTECAASLIDDYDRERWKTSNWQQLAQMAYHAWMLETDHANPSPDLLASYKESFEKAIERAEEKVQDWMWESEYYWDEGGMREEVNDLYEQKGGKFEEDEDEDEEFTVYDPDPDKTPLDEALYEECRDEIRGNYEDAYAGNAYRFFGYLLRLLDHQGAVGPGDLPDPHERHGGLPSYEDLQELGWTSQRTPVEKGIEGTLSSWHTAIVDIGKCARCGNSIGADGYCMVCGQFNDEFNRPQRVPRGLPPQAQQWQPYQPETEKIPGTFASFNPDEIQIHPIDREHNLWFDEEGNERTRYRLNWAKDPATGKWGEVPGQDWDSFLDKQGRQGEGYVAYHGDRPVASLTYVDDPAGWYMLGTAYTHPDYRQKGLFNRLVQPLRDTGKPIDAYVWNNPMLKNKVRGWRMPKEANAWEDAHRENPPGPPVVHWVPIENHDAYEYSSPDMPDYGLPFLYDWGTNTAWIGDAPFYHDDIHDADWDEEKQEHRWGVPYGASHGRYNHLQHMPSDGYTYFWNRLHPDTQAAIENEIKKVYPHMEMPYDGDEFENEPKEQTPDDMWNELLG